MLSVQTKASDTDMILSEFDFCQYHRFFLEYGNIVSPITTVRRIRQLFGQNKYPKQYNSVKKWDSFLQVSIICLTK